MTNDREQMLQRYLDGDLDGGHRAAALQLERDEAVAPELRAEVELQRRIDCALCEVFAPGAPEPRSLARIEPRSGDLSWRRLILYAAAILIIAGAGLWFRTSLHHRASFNPIDSPERIYDRLVRGGFTPEFVCEPGPEFIAAVQDRFGAPLDIAAAPGGGVDVIGWAYDANRPTGAYTGSGILSEDMLILMAWVDGEPVIVLMDRREADTRPRIAPDSDMRLFRKRHDSFILYELTPHRTPRLLGDFRSP